MKKQNWTEKEEEYMREAYPTTPNKEICKALKRTLHSVKSKAYSMGIEKDPGHRYRTTYPKRIETMDPEEAILEVLKKNQFPMYREQIFEKIGQELKSRKFSGIIRSLEIDGYDIQKVISGSGTRYGLIRVAHTDPEKYYNYQGEIETPVLQTGDWHKGNKLHSEQALDQLIQCCEDLSVATVMICGDIMQALGVHRREASDLLWPDLDYQIDVTVHDFERFPKCVKQICTVIGNHESVVKGNPRHAFDMVKAVCNRVDRAQYYGSVCNVRLDGNWEYLMMHTEGAVGYAVSYKGQRVRDNLIQRPHVLHLGHIHQPYNVPRPHSCGGANTITSASLKREGGWEFQKGWTSIVGWYVLHRWKPNNVLHEEFRPRVY